MNSEELNKRFEEISKIESIKERNESIRKLQSDTGLKLKEIQDKIKYIQESNVTNVTDDTLVTNVTNVTNGCVTSVTCNNEFFNEVFSENTFDKILKFLASNKGEFTYAKIAEKIGKKEANVRVTINRNLDYFSINKPDGKICYTSLLQMAIDEINSRIEKKEQEKKNIEERNKRLEEERMVKESLLESVLTYIRVTHPKREGKFISLDFNDLVKYDPVLADTFLDDSIEFLKIFSSAYDDELDVRIINMPQTNSINIEQVRKEHLDKIICVDGRITSFGEVKPVILKVKFECPGCGTVISVEQNYRVGNLVEPTRCSCGRRGGFKEVSRDDVNACFLQLEDLHEKTDNPHSQRIKSVIFNGLTEHENIKIFTPGNEIRCTGILKEVPIFKKGKKTLFLNWILEIMSAELIDADVEIEKMTEEEIEEINELSSKIDVEGIKEIRDSFAANIYGYEKVKEAMILQLCNKRNNFKQNDERSKSNILLIGDPGVAKSVLSDFSLKVCPGSRKAVGGGSSAVGITASVIKEEDALGGYRVEPGAMILAKSLLFIDELNNLNEDDKPKIQEGMNEQTVTINKANVRVKMSVSCGILAAANPKSGDFNTKGSETLASQFNLPTPIINRFDLIFAFIDKSNEEKDKQIATKMIEKHRGIIETKYSPEFLKKFFAYIERIEEPIIDEKTQKELVKVYSEVRKIEHNGVKIGARFLLSLKRICIAHAKLRQSKKVEEKDIKCAFEILRESQYNL
jgi:replicative DNA helicase Mcm